MDGNAPEPQTNGDAARRILLVCDRDPKSSPPGQGRRAESVLAYFLARGDRVDVRALSRTNAGLLGRAIRAMTSVVAVSKSEADLIVVCGLSAPHMLLLAMLVALVRPTYFDSCDSWNLQLKQRRLDGVRTLPIRIGLILWRIPNRIRVNSYISQRDADADRSLTTASAIIPQSAPKTLRALPDLVGVPKRIVIAADFTSFHNMQGVLEDFEAISDFAEAFPNIAVQIYGRIPAGLAIPPKIEVKGWAENIDDVYTGETAVVITNRAGSGVPNKVVEAIAARRPMLMHDSLSYLEVGNSPVSYYSTEAELRWALEQAVQGR